MLSSGSSLEEEAEREDLARAGVSPDGAAGDFPADSTDRPISKQNATRSMERKYFKDGF